MDGMLGINNVCTGTHSRFPVIKHNYFGFMIVLQNIHTYHRQLNGR